MDNQNLSLIDKIKDSEIYFAFIKSPTAIISTVILITIFFCSFFVELIAPFNPFDPSSLDLMEAFTPPSWSKEGMSKFLLGTDGQGRDMLSTILYGSRISLIVGFAAILFSLILFAVILTFKGINDKSVVENIFTAAGFTYGPLLGFFAFGMLTKLKVSDRAIPIIGVTCPVISYFLMINSEELLGYKIGFELLLVNGGLTFLLMFLCNTGKEKSSPV